MTGLADSDPWAFSCLIPIHRGDNVEHFVAAMESIGASSLAPAEILICQDGALPAPLGDAVASCMRRFGARLTVSSGPEGLQHNLNDAMTAVRTPWVARADADDLNSPDRFAAQVSFLKESPHIAALGGGILEFWPDGRSRRKHMPLTHAEIVRWARWRNPINHMTAFFRKDVFVECGGYPDIRSKEDYGLWLAMIGRGALLANLPQDLVRARLGKRFYQRRSGLMNFRSELALYELKRRIPDIGPAAAAVALVGRSCALAMSGPARLVYELGLRRQKVRS